jgi:hypothetical protein
MFLTQRLYLLPTYFTTTFDMYNTPLVLSHHIARPNDRRHRYENGLDDTGADTHFEVFFGVRRGNLQNAIQEQAEREQRE